MTAAIYFHPEAYTTHGPKLMGRNAAGESFLRGFLKYSRTSEFWAQVQSAEHGQAFVNAVVESGRKEPARYFGRDRISNLTAAGAVYYPGPGLAEHAWHRALLGHSNWSLCGITHTTSSATAMDAITGLLTAPVQAWDAVICTSNAVKSNVTAILQAQADFLAQRLGAQRLVLPQLPVIPLGIHTGDFDFTAAERAQARASIGAEESDLVVLFMGRLSFHAKAHPLAMYQALENAHKSCSEGARVILLECGWHANDFIRDAYRAAASAACPSVRVITSDGRNSAARKIAWAGADVFCSLSDNIQETFGIVPIEAMAAGLPVVVSDWDGYKDTVRDGVDGFRIPTLMPQAGLGKDLAFRHALEIDTYDMYCGHNCSVVAVDVAAATRAFESLFQSRELRQQMGAAGRERARGIYDWAEIIRQYEALWERLGELRRQLGPHLAPPPHPWPARMDPFAAFAAYPTLTLGLNTQLALCDEIGVVQERYAMWRSLAMVNFAKAVTLSEEDVLAIFAALAGAPRTAGQLVATVQAERQGYVLRGLVWLAKLGLIRVSQ